MKPFYERGGITIFCGDCLEIMPQLKLTFDAIIADWPYGTTACSWDSVIPLEPLWKECKRLSDTAVLFGSQPFTSRLIMSNINWFRYEWIWQKTRISGFLNANRRPMSAHENILVFGKAQPLYNPQMITGEAHKRNRRKIHNQQTDVYGDYNATGVEWTNQYYPQSCIVFQQDPDVTVTRIAVYDSVFAHSVSLSNNPNWRSSPCQAVLASVAAPRRRIFAGSVLPVRVAHLLHQAMFKFLALPNATLVKPAKHLPTAPNMTASSRALCMIACESLASTHLASPRLTAHYLDRSCPSVPSNTKVPTLCACLGSQPGDLPGKHWD